MLFDSESEVLMSEITFENMIKTDDLSKQTKMPRTLLWEEFSVLNLGTSIFLIFFFPSTQKRKEKRKPKKKREKKEKGK